MTTDQNRMLTFHLIDPFTPDDALEMLATLIARSAGVTHRVYVLGHMDAGMRAQRLGVPGDIIRPLPSLGWLDPTNWRRLRHEIRRHDPSHLHAWGVRGIVAAAVQAAFTGGRIATLAVSPTDRQMKLLRAAHARAPFAWVGSSSTIVRSLATRGLPRPVRIRPGIALGAAASTTPPLAIRETLGIAQEYGPVVLVGGDSSRQAQQRQALWAIGILQQLYPRTRAILRLDDSREADHVRAFADTLPLAHGGLPIAVEADPALPWATLARAADITLVAPDGPIPVHAVLWSMAAGTPVIGTATSEVSELVEHARSGLLAVPGKVRSISARLEEFMTDSRLRWPLTDTARADVYAHFRPAHLAACYRAVYQATLHDPRVSAPIELPQPEVTAADRFAGVVSTT